jgi:hypothetical protein
MLATEAEELRDLEVSKESELARLTNALHDMCLNVGRPAGGSASGGLNSKQRADTTGFVTLGEMDKHIEGAFRPATSIVGAHVRCM